LKAARPAAERSARGQRTRSRKASTTTPMQERAAAQQFAPGQVRPRTAEEIAKAETAEQLALRTLHHKAPASVPTACSTDARASSSLVA
jgi:hypothetical protein